MPVSQSFSTLSRATVSSFYHTPKTPLQDTDVGRDPQLLTGTPTKHMSEVKVKVTRS